MEHTDMLTSRDIVQAHRATSAVLDVVLAEHGTRFDRWVVLDTLATGALSPERARLVPGLVATLATGQASVEALLDDAQARGFVRIVSAPSGFAGAVRIELTAAGEALHRTLRTAVDGVVAELFAGIPVRDVVTTRHVLAEVTRRADGWVLLWSAARPAEHAR